MESELFIKYLQTVLNVQPDIDQEKVLRGLLDRQQQKNCHFCIEAIPGSGKTTTLVASVLGLLLQEDYGDAAAQEERKILCITYTVAGMMAMKQRLESFLKILYQHCPELPFFQHFGPAFDASFNFKSIDNNEDDTTTTLSLLDQPLFKNRVNITTAHSFCATRLYLKEEEDAAATTITLSPKKKQEELEQREKALLLQSLEYSSYDKYIWDLLTAYRRSSANNDATTNMGLLDDWLKPTVAITVFIDEAQDNSQLHWLLYAEMQRYYKNLCFIIIGDPQQAIFEYNGAAVLPFLEPHSYFFLTDDSNNNNKEWQRQQLQYNYRSSPTLCRFFQAYVNLNTTVAATACQFKSFLHDDSPKKEEEEDDDRRVLLWVMKDRDESQRKVLDQVLQLVKMKQKVWILARTRWELQNYHLFLLQHLPCTEAYKIAFKLLSEEAGVSIYMGTCHESKGREIENVILLNVSDQSFQSDEERRILYVGMTRARRKLCLLLDLSSGGGGGGSTPTVLSRWLWGLEEEHLKVVLSPSFLLCSNEKTSSERQLEEKRRTILQNIMPRWLRTVPKKAIEKGMAIAIQKETCEREVAAAAAVVTESQEIVEEKKTCWQLLDIIGRSSQKNPDQNVKERGWLEQLMTLSSVYCVHKVYKIAVEDEEDDNNDEAEKAKEKDRKVLDKYWQKWQTSLAYPTEWEAILPMEALHQQILYGLFMKKFFLSSGGAVVENEENYFWEWSCILPQTFEHLLLPILPYNFVLNLDCGGAVVAVEKSASEAWQYFLNVQSATNSENSKAQLTNQILALAQSWNWTLDEWLQFVWRRYKTFYRKYHFGFDSKSKKKATRPAELCVLRQRLEHLMTARALNIDFFSNLALASMLEMDEAYEAIFSYHTRVYPQTIQLEELAQKYVDLSDRIEKTAAILVPVETAMALLLPRFDMMVETPIPPTWYFKNKCIVSSCNQSWWNKLDAEVVVVEESDNDDEQPQRKKLRFSLSGAATADDDDCCNHNKVIPLKMRNSAELTSSLLLEIYLGFLLTSLKEVAENPKITLCKGQGVILGIHALESTTIHIQIPSENINSALSVFKL